MAAAGIAACCGRALSRAGPASLILSAARKSSQSTSIYQGLNTSFVLQEEYSKLLTNFESFLYSLEQQELELKIYTLMSADEADNTCHFKEQWERELEIVQKVNEQIADRQYGRLFAVVHFASRQWKVTSEDLILIEGHIQAECGDQIRMEKVLLVGGDDFTLLGRPLLGKDLVRVVATVIEKTESWPKINMRFSPKLHSQRKKIIIQPQTVLRINTIEIAPVLS